jgi:uridine kinase
MPLFKKIDKLLGKEAFVIAIDGGSASGKTTLAEILKEVYDCNVIHMDDFFLRPEQRTEARFAEAGGNVDRERFLEEVLLPLSEGKDACYRRFDCSSQTLSMPILAKAKRLTVVEGAYSMHPELAGYYDFSVFLEVDEKCRRERILKRNSAPVAERFFSEWIPLENKYFEKMRVKERCDISFEL